VRKSISLKSNSPIGIFDSGIGGLTVAHAVTKLLPNEDIIYFGDTAHLPYGEKSASAIQAYSVKICHMLLERGCKLILIACNSASSAAYELVKEYVGSKAIVVNVIDPVVQFVASAYPSKTIGLIGTKQTVNAGIYARKIQETNKNIHFEALATPLLVPMIEEGFFQNNISEGIITEYLNRPELNGIVALILGCTHYPLIKAQIEHVYKGSVDIIDSSEIVADEVKLALGKAGLLNPLGQGDKKFFVSDYTRSFEESTKLFFQENVHLEFYPLWE